jgi:hypothetical protein
MFHLLVILSLVTDSYRDSDYLASMPNPFCGNKPLFVFNNVKLFGLLMTQVWGVSLGFLERCYETQ